MSSDVNKTPPCTLEAATQADAPPPPRTATQDDQDASAPYLVRLDGFAPVQPLLVPPGHFALVAPGIYRCGLPRECSHEFLKQLRLRTILYLSDEEYPQQNRLFVEENNIKLVCVTMGPNNEPFDAIPEESLRAAVVHAVDTRNHPVLVHSNKGTHRVGCVVGCLRRLQRWALTSVFDEYSRFAGPNSHLLDRQLIELHDVSETRRVLCDKANRVKLPKWLVPAPM